MKLITILITLGLVAPAFGGKERGGGTAIVCFNTKEQADGVKANEGVVPDELINEITSIEMLDLYETKLGYGVPKKVYPIIPIKNDETELDYVEKIKTHWYFVAPKIGEMIAKVQKMYAGDRTRDRKLFPAKDVDPISPPPSNKCVYATLAWQDMEYLYLDSRLVDHPKHSKLSRGVMWLHEYARYYGLQHDRNSQDKGENSARATRETVSLLITTGRELTYREFSGRLVAHGFFDSYTSSYPFAATYPAHWFGEKMLRLSEIMRASASDFSDVEKQLYFDTGKKLANNNHELCPLDKENKFINLEPCKVEKPSRGHYYTCVNLVTYNCQFNIKSKLEELIKQHESAQKLQRPPLEAEIRKQMAKIEDVESIRKTLATYENERGIRNYAQLYTAIDIEFRQGLREMPLISDANKKILFDEILKMSEVWFKYLHYSYVVDDKIVSSISSRGGEPQLLTKATPYNPPSFDKWSYDYVIP